MPPHVSQLGTLNESYETPPKSTSPSGFVLGSVLVLAASSANAFHVGLSSLSVDWKFSRETWWPLLQ